MIYTIFFDIVIGGIDRMALHTKNRYLANAGVEDIRNGYVLKQQGELYLFFFFFFFFFGSFRYSKKVKLYCFSLFVLRLSNG